MNALKEYAAWLRAKPAVKEAYLCGSWAKGNYSPYSDVDILIIVAADGKNPAQRIIDYLPDRFPAGLDLFVYTRKEAKGNRFARELLKHAIRLF